MRGGRTLGLVRFSSLAKRAFLSYLPTPPTDKRALCPFITGIRPILGAVFLLQVRRSDTFAQVKRRIQDEQGYMANIQDFRFGDDEDGKTLDECGVVEPMTLHFQLKRKRKLIWLNGRAGVVGEEVEMGMVKREGEVGEVKGEKGEKAGGDEGGSTGDSSEGEEGSAGEGGDPEARRVRRRRDSGDRVEIRGLRSGGHSPAQ